jgi:hypothetical protein
MMAEGGCFCGAVRYRIKVEPIFVNACHCRDCQKLTGSAFALNGMVEQDKVVVTAGEEEIARREDAVRCGRCGTLLWAEHPFFGSAILFVRMGTLDEAERFGADAHFFLRSKHPWVSVPEDLPRFETLPGDDDPPLFSPAQQARVDAARPRS